MQANYKIKLLTAIAILLSPAFSIAQEAAAAAPAPAATADFGQYALISVMLVLLFVVGLMGGILRSLATVSREKIRTEKANRSNAGKIVTLLMVMLFAGFSTFAEGTEAAAAAAPAAPARIMGLAAFDFYLVSFVIILELLVTFVLAYFINVYINIIKNPADFVGAPKPERQHNWFWDNFNQAASLDKEKDILLDHDYDGIHELDNSLPPWWKYGFYLTIVIGVIYLYRFHVSHDAPGSYEEYVAEMQKGEDDKAAFLAKSSGNIDESNVKLLADANEIGAGKDLFVKNCAACHLADGGGSVGPNLADEYWLHGGGVVNVFKSIKYGWQDKGMKSWKDDFSPKQIEQLASFVVTLKGTKPATPKAPQGEVYIDATPAAAPAADSVKADTAGAGKVANK
jgi:cytochrome c oxidase cbb3-type subunit 3